MSDINRFTIELTDGYYNQMVARYRWYLDTVFFPIVRNQRLPLFQEEMDDREVYLRLQEAQRKSMLVQQGLMPPDTDTVLWDENRDGAQEQFYALSERYQREAQP